MTEDFPSSDASLELLHGSAWSICETTFPVGDVLVWLVTGANGENMIRADRATRSEAWHRAVE